MTYEAKNYENLIGLENFSEQMLKNHFTLYQGYVTNFNKVSSALAQMAAEDKLESPEHNELRRRLGWEFNGVRLHEYYFENLTKEKTTLTKGSPLELQISKDFGSVESWEKQFRATGAMRGIGWAMLCYDENSGSLFNIWINEHDTGHFAGSKPILIMDVFEHAFMTDYQLKKADYIEAFMKNVNWSAVESRLEQYVQAMKKAG